jgi:hypothetical protein
LVEFNADGTMKEKQYLYVSVSRGLATETLHRDGWPAQELKGPATPLPSVPHHTRFSFAIHHTLFATHPQIFHFIFFSKMSTHQTRSTRSTPAADGNTAAVSSNAAASAHQLSTELAGSAIPPTMKEKQYPADCKWLYSQSGRMQYEEIKCLLYMLELLQERGGVTVCQSVSRQRDSEGTVHSKIYPIHMIRRPRHIAEFSCPHCYGLSRGATTSEQSTLSASNCN